MLEKLWDDVVAGPHPETGLEKLRKATTARPLVIDKGTSGKQMNLSLFTYYVVLGNRNNQNWSKIKHAAPVL